MFKHFDLIQINSLRSRGVGPQRLTDHPLTALGLDSVASSSVIYSSWCLPMALPVVVLLSLPHKWPRPTSGAKEGSGTQKCSISARMANGRSQEREKGIPGLVCGLPCYDGIVVDVVLYTSVVVPQ